MPDSTTQRVVAVEEHFATHEYWRNTADLLAYPGSEDEAEFVRSFIDNETMNKRFSDLPTRFADMDAAGVDLSVLSLNPPGIHLWREGARATAAARDINDGLAEVIKQHPDRLFGLASVALQEPENAAKEIHRAIETLGFGGVLVASHTGISYIDDPEMEPVLTALEETDATLYLHPRMPSPQMLEPIRHWGMQHAIWGFQADAGAAAIRLIMRGTLDRHPNLKIVLGHMGEGLPYWMWRTDNIHDRTYGWAHNLLGMVKLELKPSEYMLRNFAITTSGMFDPDVLSFCLGKLGAERIMFAIDYPYEDSSYATKFLADADLDDRQRALISHGNAERLFRVPPA